MAAVESPDEAVGPRTVNLTQRRLLSPTFAFTRELVNGRIRGLNRAASAAASISVTNLEPEEFKVTDAMFKAFRDFALADPAYKVHAAMIDRNRAFIERELRFNIVTAAYGRVMGDRVSSRRTIRRLRKPWTWCQKPATWRMSSAAERKSATKAIGPIGHIAPDL